MDDKALSRAAESKAVLTNAIKQFDLVHVTLLGLVGIVVMLFVAAALPVFNLEPIRSHVALLIMVATAAGGISYLYWLNIKVHKSVTEQARLTEVLVNSLGQGFLSFDKQGVCSTVYSQACIDLLEIDPSGKPIDQVLGIPEAKREDFYNWLEVLFDPTHALGFDDAVKFLPDNLSDAGVRHVHLSYRPVRDRNERLVSIVVIATDKTEELTAVAAAQRQQDYAAMIVRIFQERNQFVTTIRYLREFIQLAKSNDNKLSENANLLRQLHTIKGAVKHFNLLEFGNL
ncbi:MAG: hypothetical protein EBZ69_09555, partial [Alphaproteobacteria bacterium]|nr:hypothetical protein [Alphaproteobacteria bacterium]NDG05424.1 hypothetical protein [Alphaproteobacteria bacterium]